MWTLLTPSMLRSAFLHVPQAAQGVSDQLSLHCTRLRMGVALASRELYASGLSQRRSLGKDVSSLIVDTSCKETLLNALNGGLVIVDAGS